MFAGLYTLSILALICISILALSQTLILLGQVVKVPAIEYYGRSTASFLALFLCATYGTLASALLNLFGLGGLGQWTTARAFKWSMYVFTRVWFEVDDPEGYLGKTRPAVLVGNHQTELDVLVLGHVFPRYCSVTAKKSLKKVPFLGWFMALSKTVFIERTSREQAVAAFDRAAEQMHTGRQIVYIFPEGTRSYATKPEMLSFKKGAFHLAVQAQVPIIPVVVANYSNVLAPKRKVFRSGVIAVRILRPVETKGKTKEDVDALLESVRYNMLRELEALMAPAQRDGIAVKETQLNGTVGGKSSGVDVGYNAAAAHPASG